MRTFAFFGEPIDMAIRKLLMEAELPKETQQIDRFLQGFADRYYECNPGVFATTGMYHIQRLGNAKMG
jgi:Sec7-like guanine-nucleotide exchange factor